MTFSLTLNTDTNLANGERTITIQDAEESSQSEGEEGGLQGRLINLNVLAKSREICHVFRILQSSVAQGCVWGHNL